MALLSVAATNPKSTYSVLTTPSQLIQKQKLDDRRNDSLLRWKDIQSSARRGDAQALYRLGLKMRGSWTNEEWTGVVQDSIRGEELIRAAAEKQHLDAMLSVWSMDGQDSDELIRIVSLALETSNEHRIPYALSGWLHWLSIERCHQGMRDVSRKITERKVSSGIISSARFDQAAFEEKFEASCSGEAF